MCTRRGREVLQKHIDRAKLWEMRRRARRSALKINHTRALQDAAALKKTVFYREFLTMVIISLWLGSTFMLLLWDLADCAGGTHLAHEGVGWGRDSVPGRAGLCLPSPRCPAASLGHPKHSLSPLGTNRAFAAVAQVQSVTAHPQSLSPNQSNGLTSVTEMLVLPLNRIGKLLLGAAAMIFSGAI